MAADKTKKRFIDKALSAPKDKGQLHRDLGIPEDQTIPETTLREAAKRKDKVGQRARFALELRGFKKGGK